jgi:AraC-like DNA-binding protein
MHQIEYRSTSVPGIETMCATTDRSFPRHTHDQYGLGIMEIGGHRSCTGRRVVTASPGSLIFVNPGEVHDGHSIDRAVRSWRMIYFGPAVFNRLRSELWECDVPEFEFAQAAFSDAALQATVINSFRAFSGSGSHSVLRDSLLLEMVQRLQSLTESASRSAEYRAPDIRKALAMIHAELASEELTLQRLATEVGLSRYGLIRAFSQQLSITPHAYIVQQRLARARTLLRKGRALAEVASLTGFTDQSHFSNAFARQFGVSPGRYVQSVG